MADLRERFLDDHPADAATPMAFWVDPFRRADLFVTARRRENAASVDPCDVAGAAHPGYAGKSWLDVLRHGSRMTSNLAHAERNPGYYDDAAPKVPPMHFSAIEGGPWHVDGEGLHRTCIARALFHLERHARGAPRVLSGVSTTLYSVDLTPVRVRDDLIAAARSLELVGDIRLEAVSRRRNDGPGWFSESYDPEFVVTLFPEPVRHLGMAEAVELISDMQRAARSPRRRLRRFLRRIMP